MKQHEPEIEELKGIDADPPLTQAELKEMQGIIKRFSEAGDKLNKEDRTRMAGLLGRFEHLRPKTNKS